MRLRSLLVVWTCLFWLHACAGRADADPAPAHLSRLEAVLSARHARAYWLAPEDRTPSDAPVLVMGGMTFGFLRRQEETVHFAADPVRRLLDHPRDPGINCLCHPEYGAGLALYDQWRELQGWILFSENHNALLILDAEGAVLAQRRFQRDLAPPGSLFGKLVQTADLAALVRPYGIEFVGKGTGPAP